MNPKSLFSFAALSLLVFLPHRSFSEGGWLERPWKPEYLTDIPHLSVSDNGTEAVSNDTRQNTMRTSSSNRNASLRGAASSIVFTPAGLAGSLPAADDASIRELTRGLDHDWERCFDFVRRHIAYAPYPGIMKGPERTLLDREGNAADISFLLCALLRASGYESATVLHLPILHDGNTASGGVIVERSALYPWLGSKSIAEATSRLASSGVDCAWAGRESLAIDHYWVALSVDGETVHLDASIKPQSWPTEHLIADDMGYDRNSMLVSAGGTISNNSVQNLSETGLADYLTARVADLRRAWTEPCASLDDYLPGKRITLGETMSDDYPDAWMEVAVTNRFPGQLAGLSPVDLLTSPSEVVNALRCPVALSVNGTSFPTIYLDEVATRTLWFSTQGGNTLSFFLDDAKIAETAPDGALTTDSLSVDVQYPAGPTTHVYSLDRAENSTYVLSIGFGAEKRDGMRKAASDVITRLRDMGLDNDAPRMIAASLQLQGQQWLSQKSLFNEVWSRLTGADGGHYYTIGISGMRTGPFVDFGNSFGRGRSYGGGPSSIDVDSLVSSALEHSIIEQLGGTTNAAVSTLKILSMANRNGLPVYFMTSNSVAQTLPLLTGYAASSLSDFSTRASTNTVYLLPGSGSLALGEWTGGGHIEVTQKGNGVTGRGMIISGGMNGGYATQPGAPQCETYVNNVCPTTSPKQSVPESKWADPVATPSGSYLDESADLQLARGLPLVWGRTYDSRASRNDGDLGKGWSHDFGITISEGTDADSVFGSGSLDAALPTVVAAATIAGLLDDSDSPSEGETARRWMVASLTAQWLSDQIPETCVFAQIGAKVLSFQTMPDGSYAPAPGVTATLTRDANGLYTLQERHGNTYRFNADKKLASITDPSGNMTTLSYTDGKLAGVQNSFGATMTLARDGNGRIVSVTDNSGKCVSYAYDASGCLTAVTDAAGEVWTYAYNPVTHRMVSKRNPNGDFLIQNTYNDYGQVTNQISSNGQAWRFGYVANVEAWNEDPKGGRLTETFDNDGRVLSRTARDGATSTTAYDGHGHVSVATDALGNRSTFTYDARDNLLAASDGSGVLLRTTRFGYDAQDRLVAVTNALGHVTTYEYDNCDRVVRVTAPDGTYNVNDWNANGTLAATHAHDADGRELRRTTLAYGAYGLPVSRTLTGVGLPASGITTRTEYNADGSVAVTIDALGNRTTFAYDAAGRLVSTTDALGHVSTIEYDRAGNVAAARDALGRVTRTTHTVSGLPLQTTLPNDTVTRTEYDSVEDISASTDVRGARRTIVRDAEGRPLSATDALGNADAIEYDALGRPIWAQDASGVESWTEYDALSRPVSQINAFGATWTTAYDKLDRAVSATTPLGRTSRIAYDNVGQLVATTRPSGAVDSFGYDDMGNQTSYTNAEGHVYGTAYDALGRVVASTNALGVQIVAMAYDANGNLVRAEDGNGAVHTYAYDALDRLVSRTSPDDTATMAYDAVGNVVSAANGTATETFAYDAMDRLVAATTEVAGQTYHTEWRRDAGGLVTNLVYAPGKVVAKTFDIEGRLVAVRDWLGHEWAFGWDAAGRLTSLSSPDGRTRTQTYDAAGRLASWRVGNLVGRSLEYDLAGRKTCDNVTAGAMPAPAEVRHAENTFDAADRLVSSVVEFGTGIVSTVTFSYDRNDAMVCAVAAGETVAFRYDADGALAGLTAGGATEATFGYDAFGNRMLAGGHIWIPDQSDGLKRPLLECDAAGNLVRAYVWAGGMLLGYIDANGALTVAHTDEQGGIVALSRTDGTILHTAQYGPHGEDWGRTGTNPTPFAWLGGFGVQRLPQDTFLGDLYLTRHRLYAPAQQRFLSSDPMGLAGGLNLYAYGNGNPVAYVDPLGLCSEKKDHWGHTVLDVVGLIPGVGEIADGINGIWYLAEGNYVDATLSFAAMAPVGGQAATGAKLARKGGKILESTAKTALKQEEKNLLQSAGKTVLTQEEKRAAKQTAKEMDKTITKSSLDNNPFGPSMDKSKFKTYDEVFSNKKTSLDNNPFGPNADKSKLFGNNFVSKQPSAPKTTHKINPSSGHQSSSARNRLNTTGSEWVDKITDDAIRDVRNMFPDIH